MTPANLQEAAELYLSQGFVLVGIPHGSKAPQEKDWQGKGISDLGEARAIFSTPHNLGLLHSLSGTCCLDIDDEGGAREVFEAIGLNLDSYLTAKTPKIRGAKGIKPVFKMPKGKTHETKKLAWHYTEDGKRKAHTVFELRGAGGQDVLPPSLHPSGIYYEWLGGYPNSNNDFLELPSELLNLWQKWEFYLPIMRSVNPYFKPTKQERKSTNTETLEIIEKFNASVDIADLLESYGYKRKGKKFVAPGSSTGLAGVVILESDGKKVVYSHHGSDPLGDGQSHDAFDVVRVLECDSDMKQALDKAREHLGMPAFEPAKRSDASHQAHDDKKPWPDKLELPDSAPDPDDMPEDMLPEILRAYVTDGAKRACLHLAFVAVILVCSLGAVVGRNLGIHPKRRDDWLELANLWSAIVAPPSSLKSHAMTEGTNPVKRLQAEATKAFKEQLLANRASMEIMELELSALKKNAKDSDKPSDFKELIKNKLEEIAKLENTKEKRIIINDITMERQGILFEENPRGLYFVKDELIGLLRMCDRAGYEAFRPFLLEGWNGKGTYSFDRISRERVEAPTTLSIAGGIQPGRLRRYIAGAISEGDEADGLLQRFQLLVWFDKPKTWRRVDQAPDKEARETVQRLFSWLDTKLPELAKNVLTFNEDDIPGLRFSDEAQGRFNEWLDQHMTKLRSDEFKNTPAFQAHLAKYSKLIPALSLLFHLCELGDNAHNLVSVSSSALELAIRWGDYLEQHARKLYALELNTSVLTAYVLAEKIELGEVIDGQKVNDIYQRNWRGLETKAQVNDALNILEKCNWLRTEILPTKGRPSRILRLHPSLLEEEKK